jgi:hypothetical protein
MLALSIVSQEGLYSIVRKLKSAFPHTTQQRPHLVRERDVLGLLREVDDDEHLLALTFWPRIIRPVPHGTG